MHPHCTHCLAKQSQAQLCGVNRAQPQPVTAIPKLRWWPKVRLQQPLSGVTSLTEMQVFILIFCDSEPDRCRAAGGKVEYCGSGPKIVGYPDQTHLLQLEWKSCGYLRKQRGPVSFGCFLLCSWIILCHILDGKKKIVAVCWNVEGSCYIKENVSSLK